MACNFTLSSADHLCIWLFNARFGFKYVPNFINDGCITISVYLYTAMNIFDVNKFYFK